MSMRLLGGAVLGFVLTSLSAAHAQTWYREMTSYPQLKTPNPEIQLSLLAEHLPCGWNYYWDPPEGFSDIDVFYMMGLMNGGTTYSNSGTGIGGFANVEVMLDGTYLPSTTLQCGTYGYLSLYNLTFPFTAESVTWQNSFCDGYPIPYGGNSQPTMSYSITQQLIDYAGPLIASYAEEAQNYWTNVGSELNYSALQTPFVAPHTGDVLLYDGGGIDVSWVAFYHPTRIIEINWSNYGGTLTGTQWTYSVAHELGHAIGVDDTSSGDSVMRANFSNVNVNQPRTIDKCAAVARHPVNLKLW
jgi:hypothetical protein